MDPAFLLLGSPLTGPGPWRPVADALAECGHRVATADPRETPELDSPVVLVPHSNAGLYAPGVAARVGAAATVYVDAALPLAEPDTPLAPPELLDTLRRLADQDGVLPPWTHWWPEADVAALFPDEATRRVVEAEQPRLPLASFERRIAVPAGWTGRPSAYLAFGDTYADEVDRARTLGWPVTVMPGRHLHQLHDPVGVADEVLRLAALVTA